MKILKKLFGLCQLGLCLRKGLPVFVHPVTSDMPNFLMCKWHLKNADWPKLDNESQYE